MKKIFLLLTVIFVFTFWGCHTVFYETEAFNLSWNSKHIVTFTTETIDTGTYQEILIFRYGEGYPFSKLKILLKTTGSKKIYTNTDFIINITDEEGNYIGDGMGEIWDVEQPLDTLTIKMPTTLKFQISQKVIDGNLPMVMEVGIKLKYLHK